MKRKPIRLSIVWLLALALALPSFGACAGAMECDSGSCTRDSRFQGDKPESPPNRHGVKASIPEGHGHQNGGECGDEGNCTCGCYVATPDASFPGSPVALATPTLSVAFFLEPAATLFFDFVRTQRPGFFGYDSGPPAASPRLPIQDRSPPALRA